MFLQEDESFSKATSFRHRCFPPGCGTRSNLPDKAFKNPRISDAKNPRFFHNNVVAAIKRERARLQKEQKFANSDHGRVVSAYKPEGTLYLRRKPEIRNSDHDPSPREKVLEVLRLYKNVFRQLDRDKAARRGGELPDATSRTDLKTQTVIEKMGEQLNTEKRIGRVPGIQVGDVFQYKTELRVVGLHFKNMSGIDYVTIGDEKIATSIVSSEGYGYNDKFAADVVVYTGEGGHLITKEKETDQKLVKGNLAFPNSMRKKSDSR